jgi:dihydropyrimidinase
MTVDTVIHNGTIVTASDTFEASIAIDGGEIAAVGKQSHLPESEDRIDASGLLVLPGIVDPHVHIDYDPPRRLGQYQTETAAAALGGVTTCIDFARPPDSGGTLLDGIKEKQSNAAEALVDFSLHGILTPDDVSKLHLLSDAIEAGVTSFKMFTVYDIGVSNGFIHRAFERINDLGAVALVHTEDGDVCDEMTARLKAERKRDPIWYPRSRPDFAEAMAAEDIARMATETGVKYYNVHTTCRKSADVLEQFQNDGGSIRGETCTHYTALDKSSFEEDGNLPIISPPLRTPADIDAIFEYLKNGVLSVVSSDHVVQNRAQKNSSAWWDVSPGANGLQTGLAVFHEMAINERGLSYPFLVRMKCTNPAQTFGLPRKGTLDPQTDADIVLFDPDETFTIDATDNQSNADYSIYDGIEVTGRVKKTLVRGTVVAEDGDIVGKPGHGSFIERELPVWQ